VAFDIRTAQPTSPTIGPADSGGVSARSAVNVAVHLHQDKDALLPALSRPGGQTAIVQAVMRNGAFSVRGRHRQ